MAYFGGVGSERPWPRVNPGAALLMVVAVVFIGGSSYVLLTTDVLKQAFASQHDEIKPIVETPTLVTTEVLVPNSTIRAGKRLYPEMFHREARNIQGMEGKLVNVNDDINSYFALSNIPAGTLLFKEQVSDVPPRNLITARIPEGFRAVSISVDAESGVEGWARPGAKVDVVWSTQQRGRQMVSTIVENAEVLSAARSTETTMNDNRDSSKPLPSQITLLVAVKDAQKIQLAKASGSLTLNLRGDGEEANRGNEAITVDRLLKGSGAESNDDVQGTVQFNGKEYQVKGGKLVAPAKEK